MTVLVEACAVRRRRRDAVELDPPVTLGGSFRGQCLHCGGVEWLPEVYPAEDWASAFYYWGVFSAATVTEYPDVFFGDGDPVAKFTECREAFELAIQQCVLLAQVDGVAS
jgi:hypothetical protein